MENFTIEEIVQIRETLANLNLARQQVGTLRARFLVDETRKIEIENLDWGPTGDQGSGCLVADAVDALGFFWGIPKNILYPREFPAGEGQLWVMGDNFLITYNEGDEECEGGFNTFLDEIHLAVMVEASDAYLQRWEAGMEEAGRRAALWAEEETTYKPSAAASAAVVARTETCDDDYFEVEE
ncbi:MAG: hypothetical protein EBZ48_16425 [Proteobacteria bacterium]|nr:hypothetical protein [Pseudomonadota bacterium]